VQALLRASGLRDVASARDLAGIPRVTYGFVQGAKGA